MAKLTNKASYAIKEIVKVLPAEYYRAARKYRHVPRWFAKTFNFLACLWVTARICRWYFNSRHTMLCEVNHERRIRRAYDRSGIPGVRYYLSSRGMTPELINELTQDF